jgi:hypothetical protein
MEDQNTEVLRKRQFVALRFRELEAANTIST